MAVNETTNQIVKSVCSRGQIISVHLREGRVAKIEGDAMGDEAALERLFHSNRLKYPQRRIGDAVGVNGSESRGMRL
jgi:hypothetical protein